MKRYGICLVALLVASCAAQPETGMQQTPPTGVHVAPGSGSINLTPTRDGPAVSPQGFVDPATLPGANIATGKPIRVGLLLPLTGRNAALGKDMLDAATLSLFDKYARLSTAQQSVRVELLPKDTGDTPEEARRAMAQAIHDGASLIIGPIFSDATAAAAPIATDRGISVISFTNNAAQARPGVYVFGFSPQEQAARVIGYAMGQGKTRIAALVPDTVTGEIILQAARARMQQSNQTLVAEAKYAPQGMGIEAALAKLMPNGAVNFDTLLLPEGGPALNTILRALSARGVSPRNVQFIGTGFWDEPDLLRRTALTGAWLASSPPQLTAQFEQRFSTTYHYVPARIASLAYDAVALAVTLATSGRGLGDAALTKPVGYSGPANGIFRMTPNGMVERGLAVLQVDGASLSVIEPAPAGFNAAAR